MSDVRIIVRGLSKLYGRGPEYPQHAGMGAVLLRPYRRLRGLPVAAPRASEFWALKDVTFDVHDGERIGIIGRNGAGKSTLLKILSRIIYPTEGEARIRGRVTSLLEVGTGFNSGLSGRENIYLNASVHGLERKEIDARFDEIVEFSGIRDFIDTPVKHYSSGMYMRLAFSVAAHLDPDILLLDEVLAVGDLSFQQKCLKHVEGLTAEGRTVLFVSHSMDAIARFCSRCIWLERGKIVQDGPSREVSEAYIGEMLGVQPSRQWAEEAASSRDASASSGGSGTASPEPAAAPIASNPVTTATDPKELQAVSAATSRQSLPSPSLDGLVSASNGNVASDHAAPGDDYVRLVSARVVNKAGSTIVSVAIDEAFGIEVVYDILKEGKNIQPALHFKTTQDTYAFAVAYTDPTHMRRLPQVGRYAATAWVPPNLLNSGIMWVAVAMATPDPFERHCIVERALSFNVHEPFDGADGTARGLYARIFPGAVRPKLRWDTRKLEQAAPCR